MHQQEIKFFWSLTEQIPLALDYQPSYEYEAKKRVDLITGSVLISNSVGLTWAVVNRPIEPSFTIDVDQTPITITSKDKPNFFKRYIYKMLGMKWKAK